jgi:hypothetical protein
MGVYPSAQPIIPRKELSASFISSGERLVKKLGLLPGQGVIAFPLLYISGGISIATSFRFLQSSYNKSGRTTLKIFDDSVISCLVYFPHFENRYSISQ